MNAAEMVRSLQDSSEFLRAQKELGFTDRESEVNSLCNQILELRSLDKGGAASLSRALADMDWETPEQVKLAKAVRERSQKDSAAGKKGCRPRQNCSTFELYLKKESTDMYKPTTLYMMSTLYASAVNNSLNISSW